MHSEILDLGQEVFIIKVTFGNRMKGLMALQWVYQESEFGAHTCGPYDLLWIQANLAKTHTNP